MSFAFEEQSRETELVARAASHVDDKFAPAQERCRQALVKSVELDYLGHYTDGAYDFSYDRLAGTSGQPDRLDYERIGVQITNATRGLDRKLQDVRTGALIRTVVHGRQGLVICDSARPDEHVVGFSQAPTACAVQGAALSELAGARNVDQAIGELVTKLREQVSLGPQNPGSWISAKPDRVEFPEVDNSALLWSHVERASGHIEGIADQRLADLFLDRVHPADLQLVAHCRNGQVEYWVDQLGHPSLGPYFQEISVIERRLFYQNMCSQLPMIARKLGRMAVCVTGGKIERLVLDVEQGAIYYYRIRPAEYLVGVTIDQRRVAASDRKIAEIALAYLDDSLITHNGC